MEVGELRDVCENLGRFAAVRDKAPYPTDRILIQAVGGILKFVAGDEQSTLIVNAGATDQNGAAIVSARTLLTAAKSLKGKGQVDLSVSNEGATLRFGAASVSLPPVSDRIPSEWLRPSADVEASTTFPAGFIPAASKAVASVAEKHGYARHASIEYGARMGFFATGNALMVSAIAGDAPLHPVQTAFFGSLRGIEDAGLATYHGNRLTSIKAGKYHALHRCDIDQTPVLSFSTEHDAAVQVERKALADALKMASNGDEFGRVRITAADNTLTLVPKANESAAIRVPAIVKGSAAVWLQSALLVKALNGLTGKASRLSWAGKTTAPIRIGDDDSAWFYYLAPVIL